MLIVIILNWLQFLSLWGLGVETPRFRTALKPDPLPWTYVVAFLSAFFGGAVSCARGQTIGTGEQEWPMNMACALMQKQFAMLEEAIRSAR